MTVEMAAPSPKEQTADAPTSRRNTKPTQPSDFDSLEEFLQYVRKLYDRDKEADKENRDEMILDARFVAGEQWDATVKQKRDQNNKPTLTINRLPAYVAQLVGNRRMNDIGIKIIPDTGGTKKVADVREGLIRSIQKLSRAQYAFDKAFEQQVIGGLGNFQILLEYANDDVFEQDIRIASIPNPLSVIWDQNSVDPSGADARHVFVVDSVARDDFKKKYPDAQASDWEADTTGVRSHGWDTSDTVQIVSFWRMRSKKRLLALMQDNTVEDVTDFDAEEWWDLAATRPDGTPMIREVQRKYAQMYMCTSQDILAGPYELPIPRVPVFRVPGWEVFIESVRIRWGLVRFARDPQKLHNYWRSTIAEKLVGAPKAKWLAADTAVDGREDQWRKSHLSDDPLLVWNADSGAPPVRTPPLEVEGALIEQAGVASQDIRDVTNIHEAQLGDTSNEVSGRAIMARQRVGEVGTVIYQDNLNIAIEEAGRVVNELIPFVYDTPRVIKVLGEDMLTEKQIPINYGAEDELPGNYESGDIESIDITCGKYSVTVTTGPSYTTRRVEAREEMMAMVNAMPQTMAVAADKIIEAQDWPGASEIARRVRSQLPPGMIDEKDLTDEEKRAMAFQAQNAEQQQQIQQLALQLEIEEQKAKIALTQAQIAESEGRAREAFARAQQAEAQAAKLIADIEKGQVETALKTVETLQPAEKTGATN